MNQTAPFDRRSIILSAFLSLLITVLMAGMALCIFADKDLQAAYKFSEVFLTISDNYSEVADPGPMLTAARQAMFRDLDVYSGFIEPEDFARMREELSGGYSGIGVSVIGHDRGLLVMGVNEGGPASLAGLLVGDIIIATDSVILEGLDGDTAVSILRGEVGVAVTVEVYRPAEDETFSVDIIRGEVPLIHVPYAGITPDSMVYIRLVDFESGASHDVEEAVDSLLNRDGFEPGGLILDLRGNPGGLFSEAYKTVNLFLESGLFIVGTDARSRWRQEEHFSSGEDITGGLPLAVMVDGYSASSAEITAGALGQLDRAILVGDTTFGKGLVQGFTRFFDGSGLRLTISRYYLEGGVYLNAFDSMLQETGSGLPPDYYQKAVTREHFPRVLENSLLLHRFAALNQDRIVADSRDGILPEKWLDVFADFASENDFVYRSNETQIAELVVETAIVYGENGKILKQAEKLVQLASREDMHQMDKYSLHIRTRLKQLAFERKYDLYRSFAAIVADGQPDLMAVSDILRGLEP